MGAHALRHTKPPLLQQIREKILYAVDMYGTAYNIGAAPTEGVSDTNAIRWRFDPDTDQGVCGDLKIPIDRVIGTPLKLYFIYSIPTGPGGGVIVWRLDYRIIQQGGIIPVVPTTRTVLDTTPARNLIAKTSPIEIPAWQVDVTPTPLEINMGIIRWAANPGDTETSTADLYKLIMEYTAYV